MTDKMRITYIFHSGFAVETSDALLVIDCWRDPAGVVRRLSRDTGVGRPLVFAVTHRHHDHFNPAIFDYATDAPCRYILSDDIPADDVPPGLNVTWVHPGSQAQVAALGVEAFGSTDVGVSLMFSVGGRLLFHSGDLNDWHWQQESTQAEVDAADRAFDADVAAIAAGYPRVDVMMMAVDPRMGDDFPRGARKMVRAIKVGFFFPMHFWERPAEACDFPLYANPAQGRYICLSRPGETAEIDFTTGRYKVE